MSSFVMTLGLVQQYSSEVVSTLSNSCSISCCQCSCQLRRLLLQCSNSKLNDCVSTDQGDATSAKSFNCQLCEPVGCMPDCQQLQHLVQADDSALSTVHIQAAPPGQEPHTGTHGAPGSCNPPPGENPGSGCPGPRGWLP